MKPIITDCFICAIRPLISLGATVSYIATPDCPHRANSLSNHPHKPKFLYSKSKTLFATSWILIVLAELIYICRCLRQNETPPEKKANYTFMFPALLNTLCFSMSFIVYNKDYMLFTNGFLEIIEQRKLYGIDTMLTSKIMGYYSIYSKCMSILHCSTAVLQVLVFLYKMERFELDYIGLTLALLVCTVNTGSYVAFFVSTITVYYIMLSKMREEIETALHRKEETLSEKLRILQRFYLLCVFNYKRHIFAYGTMLMHFTQFLFEVASLVDYLLNAYFLTDDDEFHWMAAFRVLFLNYGNAFIGFYIWLINQLILIGDDLLSFLYKYPINRLSRSEASQVEMLILTLTLEKPILRASDIFTVGTVLLSTVSGNAVTYVLVALQFNVLAVFSN
ncbi:unnamed protein product [Phyllotreta striolata]|uniref:Uncharacterized protein n=1 Tax=Phyllotreta striolata TaxID=444603 RepID=A0A9N9XNW6_PHYSR|nr:unnamed protein product [Phyllotreta striolata]